MRGQFLILSIDKNFFDPLYPNFVHVVTEWPLRYTVAINDLLHMKNAGAQIAMDFS